MKDLLVLVYTPREDSPQRNYEDWLREVDAPFFNSVPGIAHYTNWKFTSPANCAVPYTHFDLMYVDDPNKLDAVWGNPDVEKFAQEWTDQWGRYPDASPEEMHLNYQVYLCERVSGKDGVPRSPVTFLAAKGDIPKADKRQTFVVKEPVLGDVRFTHFALDELVNTGDFPASANSRPDICYGAALGEIVASPDLT